MTRGMALGKFMPPHNGHKIMCEFAADYVDEMTILVCSMPGEPICGDLRAQWMRELFPNCRVQHLDREVPQEPGEHPEFWSIWRNIAREFHPEPIDFWFASEPYGHRMAEITGSVFVPVDPKRLTVQMSGAVAREDIYKAWWNLTVPVRSHFTKTVCVFGPESSGKSTLADALSKALVTTLVPEYGRIYTEEFGANGLIDGDLQRIAKGHKLLTKAARKIANRVLVCDTDPLMTAVWSQMLLGSRSVAIQDVGPPADLYLLCDIDIPWQDDGTRYFEAQEDRKRFYALCEQELDDRGLRYVKISGDIDHRVMMSTAAIAGLFE